MSPTSRVITSTVLACLSMLILLCGLMVYAACTGRLSHEPQEYTNDNTWTEKSLPVTQLGVIELDRQNTIFDIQEADTVGIILSGSPSAVTHTIIQQEGDTLRLVFDDESNTPVEGLHVNISTPNTDHSQVTDGDKVYLNFN